MIGVRLANEVTRVEFVQNNQPTCSFESTERLSGNAMRAGDLPAGVVSQFRTAVFAGYQALDGRSLAGSGATR